MIPLRILVSGHARLPQESAAKSVYDVLSIVAEVETKTWKITEVDSALITGVAQRFVRRILVGRSLLKPVDEVLREIELTYHGGAKRAVLAAVRELYENAGEVRAGFQQ